MDDETKEAVLTDVGGDVPYLLQQVQNKGLKLTAIWLTHGHLDHAGGVVELLKTCDVPVLGPHKDDEFLLQALPQTTAQYGFPVSPSFTPARWLEEGETLKVAITASKSSTFPATPPAKSFFYNAENGLLVAGDVLFYETVGRTDFPRGNHDDLINNIRAKLLTLPETTQVIAGHGRMTNIGHEKRYNPFLVR